MRRGVPGFAATVVFATATSGAALADGLAHSPTRPLATALVEGLPALLLGVAAVASTRRGARLFGAAVLVLACGVVATFGERRDGPVLVLAALFPAGALLAAAFLRSAAGAPNRRRVVALFVPLAVLAGLFTAVAVGAGASLSRTKCGVDNCAFTGLGVAFALGAAFELMLLAALVAALGADLRAGAGVALFAIGLNLVLAVAPVWSRYQGVAGVAAGYAGLGLAGLPWLMPQRARAATVSLSVPDSGL